MLLLWQSFKKLIKVFFKAKPKQNLKTWSPFRGTLNTTKVLRPKHATATCVQATANQKGQATLEFILLIIVGIALALALTAQFFKPVGNFVNNVVGDYFQCLLDTGELPVLGGESESECTLNYEGASGTGLNADSAGGGRGRGGRGDQGRNSEDDEGSGSEVAGGSSGGAGGSGGGGGRRRSGRRGGGKFGTGPNANVVGSQGVGESSLSDSGAGLQNKRGTGANYAAGEIRVVHRKRFVNSGAEYQALLQKEQNKKVKRTPANIGKGGEDGASGSERQKKFKMQTNSKKQVEQNESEEMDWGKYIKYLVIGGIVVAVLVFFGMQVMQATKSWDGG